MESKKGKKDGNEVKKDDNEEMNKGWSKEGIQRFNELCEMVKKDREKNGKADEEPLKEMKPLMKTNQSRKHAKLNDPIAKACVDIDIDDDVNSSEGLSSDGSDN